MLVDRQNKHISKYQIQSDFFLNDCDSASEYNKVSDDVGEGNGVIGVSSVNMTQLQSR